MDNPATIYGTFLAIARNNLDKLFIGDELRTLTYGQFLEIVGAIAGRLPADEPMIGVVMHHGIEQIASMFAILSRGAAYVPVEPDFPPERIRFMMEECDVRTVVTQKGCTFSLDGPRTVLIEPGFEAAGASTVADDSTPEAIAYVLYTSGTTGRPKGVQVTNANVCNYARAFAAEFHPDDRDTMLQYSVCTFDIFVEEVFATLLSGAHLAIPAASTRSRLESTLAFANERAVTIMSGFPYLFAEMNARRERPRTLRLAISGGDVLHASQVDWLIDEVDVYNTYGPSETTVCATYFHCNGAAATADGTYPIGRAIAGCRVRLVDGKRNPVPAGEIGEIEIAGAGVSAGYRHAREDGAFLTEPDGSRVYLSGDEAYELPSGDFVFVHRKDTQVMIDGRRVETGEVENVLTEAPGVKAAVVRADVDGHGRTYLSAYLVFADEPVSIGAALGAIKDHLRRYLPPYMMPTFFVKMATMPLTPHGKPDMGALPVVLKD